MTSLSLTAISFPLITDKKILRTDYVLCGAAYSRRNQMSKKKKIIIIIPILLAVIAGSVFLYLYSQGLSGLMAKIEIKPDTIKLACVGDSVTYGHGINNWTKNTYPAVLGDILGDGYSVLNLGNSGTTVQNDGDQPYTNTKQYQVSLECEADIIVLMLGSNDSKPQNWKSAEAFRKAYSELLDTYLETGAKVYVCTSPEAFYANEKDSTLTSFDICPAVVDEIAVITREIAEEKGVEIIDIHALTEGRPELFLSDCVHPDNSGAKAIAEAVYAAISH